MVLDFTEIKMIEMVKNADSETEQELASALLELYMAGTISAKLIGGELMFSMSSVPSKQLELDL